MTEIEECVKVTVLMVVVVVVGYEEEGWHGE